MPAHAKCRRWCVCAGVFVLTLLRQRRAFDAKESPAESPAAETQLRVPRCSCNRSRKASLATVHLSDILEVGMLLRMGWRVHTGACISGVVGTKSLRFCLLGEAVDVAAAMEQGGVPGCIHASEAVVELAPDHDWEARAERDGAGCTYLLRMRWE